MASRKERHDLRLQRVVDECRKQGVAVRFVSRAELDQMAGNNAHQGVVAVTSAKQYNDLDDVVEAKRGQYSLLVVLDGVEDPHNLGAVIRTADASGADGVIIPERRAASVTAHGGKGVGGGERALAGRESYKHCAHAGRIESQEHMDGWLGRARSAKLRRSRLQHGLRYRSRS